MKILTFMACAILSLNASVVFGDTKSANRHDEEILSYLQDNSPNDESFQNCECDIVAEEMPSASPEEANRIWKALGVDLDITRDLAILPLGFIPTALVGAAALGLVTHMQWDAHINPKSWGKLAALFMQLGRNSLPIRLMAKLSVMAAPKMSTFMYSVVGAPIIEEGIVRLFLQHGLMRELPKRLLSVVGLDNHEDSIVDSAPIAAMRIAYSSLLFGYMHWHLKGPMLLLMILGGGVYGTVMEMTSSIFPSIVMHAMWNTVACL